MTSSLLGGIQTPPCHHVIFRLPPVTPVICTAMIDTTIAIRAHLIVIMMTYASECVEPLSPFQTISQPRLQPFLFQVKYLRWTLNTNRPRVRRQETRDAQFPNPHKDIRIDPSQYRYLSLPQAIHTQLDLCGDIAFFSIPSKSKPFKYFWKSILTFTDRLWESWGTK